jgi:S1-C subfamily serine protease
MMRVARLSCTIALFLSVQTGAMAQQFADPEFDAKVDRPAFTNRHPVVFMDAAHNNFHTAEGRYKPFAELLKNDGYTVAPNRQKFTSESLKGCAILVVSNAQGAPLTRSPETANAAFDAAECDAVHDWVEAGGSLLLIADHYPWAASNEILSTKLGVEMGKSMTLDPTNAERGFPAQLNFSRLNGLLGEHPILMGRDGSERIDRVVSFTGQSLKGPEGSVPLLKLASSAFDQSRPAIPGRNAPAAGRAQGLAITLGRGKVVVLGEAAMLSAQVNGNQRVRMGMNVPGTDNRQFGLNIMHWLSGLKLGAHEELIAAKPQPTTPADAGIAAAAKPAADIAQPRRTDPGRSLSSAEIAAESEPSIAMITGDGSVGTGFLVRPGVIATNAHVIEGEFMSTVRVRFPSAEKGQQGPVLAELLYEDTLRDLAFLRVKTSLPALRIAGSYKFRKGEDVTAIGNPGAGAELILENAISRGLMSTRTSLEGQRYYQLSIAVNPGNSGGPVFDSKGSVIGVVTRKSSEQESLAFCIPVEELNLALEKVDSFPPDAIARQQSRHRLILAVKELGGLGAFYSVGITSRRGKGVKVTSGVFESFFIAGFERLNNRAYPRLKAEVGQVQQDSLVSQELREKVGQLGANLDKLRTLFSANNPGDEKNEGFSSMQATHLRLLTQICNAVHLDLPVGMQAAFGHPPDKKSQKGASKE